MCTTVRAFGVELEGYTNRNLVGHRFINDQWTGVRDGSLSNSRTSSRNRHCPDCTGNGGHSCSNCDGDGWVYERCQACNGDHALVVTCVSCSGRGTRRNDSVCPHCEGAGKRTIQCRCDADGDVRAECSHCGGNGRIVCQTCNGRGVVREGDANDDRYGVEFVSARLNDTEPINQIFDYIREYRWYTDHTCGLHIHVDARDLDPADIRKLVTLMIPIEPIIYGMNTLDRFTSRYCKKMDTNKMSQIIATRNIDRTLLSVALYGYPMSGVPSKYMDERYYGLNLHSYFYRSTIEFRYFDGGTDAREVENYVLMCTRIVDFAKTATYQQILTISDAMIRCSSFEERASMIKEIFELEFDIEAKSTAFTQYRVAINPSRYEVAM